MSLIKELQNSVKFKSKFDIGDYVSPKYNNDSNIRMRMLIVGIMFREPKDSPWIRYNVTYYLNNQVYDYWVDETMIESYDRGAKR